MTGQRGVSARLRQLQARAAAARLTGHLGNVALIGVALTLELKIWDGERATGGGRSLPPEAIVVATIVAFAFLLLRRRHPLGVFALHVGYAVATSLQIPKSDFSVGVLISLHAVAARYPPRRSAFALPMCALTFGLQQYRCNHRITPVVAALSIVITVTVWLLGYRAWRAVQLQADIDAATAQALRAEQLRADIDATTAQALRAERLRLAHELHDIVSHSVSVMVLHAAGARTVLANDPERAEAALRVIQETGTQSMNELRRLLGLLRQAGADQPDQPEQAEHQPGLEHLPELLHQMRGAGLVITAETTGTPGRLDPSVDLAAYRVVQESLTNTLKHAGAGSVVRVNLHWELQALVMTVQDHAANRAELRNGRTRLSAGHGLLGLRERVATVGGTVDAYPIDNGYLVQATLPLAAGVRLDPTPPLRSQPEGISH